MTMPGNLMGATARRSALVVAIVAMSATGALAQSQPSRVNPTESSVREQQLLEALKPGSVPGATQSVGGRVSIPDKASGNLIQPAGKEYRDFHQRTVPTIGAGSILGMLALIVVFFLARGRIRLQDGFTGEQVVRFNGLERFAHWLTAVSFIALGLTGLNLTFGKTVLLPLMAPETFTWLTQLGKFVHNYVSFAFTLGVVLMLVLWIKDNFPHPRDFVWLARGGGIFGHGHVPAGRFNLGQKLIFWSVILGGAGLAISGYVLMFPFRFTDIAGQQLASIVHALVGAILIAIIIAHIYIGTLGMEGAFDAMGTGNVDANWAKAHHSVWYERLMERKAAGKARGSPAPAE